MSVLHQTTCIFKDSLSDLSDGWAKYKEKILDVTQIPIKMLKKHAISNSSFQNLKIYLSKRCRKTSQRWIMYVDNTAIPELRIFSGRKYFRLSVFASTGEYVYCWGIHFALCAHKWCICILQIGSFNLSL